MFAPMFLSAASSADKNPKGEHYTTNKNNPNQPFCLFAELDSSEEIGEGHKELNASFNFDIFCALNFQFEDENSSLVIVRHIFECHTSTPKLFILNCLLLI